MKKLIIIVLVLMLVVSMAVPAYAVTPKFEIPELPEVPEIKPDFSWIDFDEIFERWFSDHPIRIKSVRLG